MLIEDARYFCWFYLLIALHHLLTFHKRQARTANKIRPIKMASNMIHKGIGKDFGKPSTCMSVPTLLVLGGI